MAFGKRWGELRVETTTTPLTLACYKGDVAAISALLQQGAGVDQQDDDGYTPLFVASLKGHVDAARLLLDAGAAVDKRREGDWSPFGIACALGHVDVATLLVERGADTASVNTCSWRNAAASVCLQATESRRNAAMSRAWRRCELGEQRGRIRFCMSRAKTVTSAGAVVAGQRRGGRSGGQARCDAAMDRVPERPRRCGAAVAGQRRGGRSGGQGGRRRCTSPARTATSTRRGCCWTKARRSIGRMRTARRRCSKPMRERPRGALALVGAGHVDATPLRRSWCWGAHRRRSTVRRMTC